MCSLLYPQHCRCSVMTYGMNRSMNEWRVDLMASLTSFLAHWPESGEPGPAFHVLLLCAKASCHPPLRKVPRIMALSPIFCFFPHLEYLQGAVPTLQPGPALSSANHLLPYSCAVLGDGGADQNGWEPWAGWGAGAIWWLQPHCRALELLQGCTEGSRCMTIKLSPIYSVPVIRCIDCQASGWVTLPWL